MGILSCLTQFEKSVPMVTYLVCFIVCDFEYEEKFTDVHRTRFRVYASPVQKASLEYALRIGTNITDFFEDYFEVSRDLALQGCQALALGSLEGIGPSSV